MFVLCMVRIILAEPRSTAHACTCALCNVYIHMIVPEAIIACTTRSIVALAPRTLYVHTNHSFTLWEYSYIDLIDVFEMIGIYLTIYNSMPLCLFRVR
jgi:hypothetical protein